MNFAMASLSQNKIKVLLTYTCPGLIESLKNHKSQNGCWSIEWDWSEQSEFPWNSTTLHFRMCVHWAKSGLVFCYCFLPFIIWWGSWLWFDVCLVVLDFVLMLEMVPDSTKALTLFRLFRFAKFKHVPWSYQQILKCFLLEIELNVRWVYDQSYKLQNSMVRRYMSVCSYLSSPLAECLGA